MNDIVDHWSDVEADLLSHFGIDLWDDDLMNRRPWKWLQHKIYALLSANTRIARWARSRQTATPTPTDPIAALAQQFVDVGQVD